MTDIQPFSSGASPFDAIRRVDADGIEWWSARTLMPVLGYEKWERFADAIERAAVAAANSGHPAEQHFSRLREVGTNWTPGSSARSDYRLTRFGAYLTSMNGDPRKPEIAAAQTYFAVRTREVETRQPMPDLASPAGILAMADLFQRTAQQLVAAQAQIAEMEPKALAHDTFLVAAKSDRLVKQVAKELGWREGVLRDFLLNEHLIYQRYATCGRTEYDFYATFGEHFATKETQVQHTFGPCNHYTLYITPRGMALIRKRIADRQAEQQTAIKEAAL